MNYVDLTRPFLEEFFAKTRAATEQAAEQAVEAMCGITTHTWIADDEHGNTVLKFEATASLHVPPGEIHELWGPPEDP